VPPDCRFRPRGFAPPRRLERIAGRELVASHCRTGFAEFQLRSDPGPKTVAPHGPPRQRIHTLRSVPLAGSRTASLRPLPPRRSPVSRALDHLTMTVACRVPDPDCAGGPKTPVTPGRSLPAVSGDGRTWTAMDWLPTVSGGASAIARCRPSLLRPTDALASSVALEPASCRCLRSGRSLLSRASGLEAIVAFPEGSSVKRAAHYPPRPGCPVGFVAGSASGCDSMRKASCGRSAGPPAVVGQSISRCWQLLSHPCGRSGSERARPDRPDRR
jgi:hypothetical protein